MLVSVLQDYGMSEKEANLYLICLELGTAPVSSIARRANSNRVTVYSILKNLVKQGVATQSFKNKSTYYSVISPKQLLKKMEDKCKNFQETLPEFLAMENKLDNKPKIQFFDGLEGLKQVYDDILESPNEGISAFLGVGAIGDKLLNYLNLHFLPKRVKIGISAKVLLGNQSNIKYQPYQKAKNEFLTEYRVLDHEFFKLYNEINIYGGDKVSIVMFSEDEMSGLIIRSKKLHDSMKSIFDLARSIGAGSSQQTKKSPNKKSSPLRKKTKS